MAPVTKEDEELAILESMARDPDLKATQRLRALEELGKRRARSVEIPADSGSEEVAPDPMADLDEMEAARLRRKRRASA